MENENENKGIKVDILVNDAYKTVMIPVSMKELLPQYLYYQLEYLLKFSRGSEDFMNYKVKLVDVDTTVADLKEGRWSKDEG